MNASEIRRFFRRLLNALRPGRRDADAAREIAAHLQLIEDDLVARGVPPAEARRQARVALGGADRTREIHREARAFLWIEDIRIDARYAVRLLRRQPAFAVTAVLSLALGLGAATTIFTAANALLLQAAPGVRDPGRLVDISRTAGGIGVEPVSYAQYEEIRQRVTRVRDVYAYALNLSPMSLSTDASKPADAIFADVVSANYFTALGVVPAAGRLFTESDREPVVVLSDRFWQRVFGGDARIVGSTLRLSDVGYTVVGIAAPEFHGNTVLAPDVWLPATPARPIEMGLVGARLEPGVRLAEAASEVDAVGKNLADRLRIPGLPDRGRRFGLAMTRSSPVPAGVRVLVGGFLALLMAIVALVLVIACTNVAGVLLARAAARSREMAVRMAIGVGRGRLIRQLLTETVVLFTAAGAAGLVVSRGMSAAIVRALPAFPLPSDLALAEDARVLAFAMGVAMAAAFVFGLTPALHASRVDVLTALKAHEQGHEASLRLRRGFVIAQLALSVTLIVVAGLLGRALGRAGSIERGFDARGVEVLSLDLSLAGYTAATGPAVADTLLARTRALPGVAAAALAESSPSGGLTGFQVAIPGTTTPDGQPFFQAVGNTISPGYFATTSIRLAAGRDFTDLDSAGAERVVVVSEAAVRRFWGGVSAPDALGRQILIQPFRILFDPRDPGSRKRAPAVPYTVVGVAADVTTGGAPEPCVYLPMAQGYVADVRLLVRSADGQRLTAPLRSVVATVDRRLPILSAGSLADEAGPVITQLRIAAIIAGSLGVLAVVLAGIGVYGVTAFMVVRRTREIGIRVALGADRGAVTRMALGEAVRLAAAGGVLGLVGGALAGRVLRYLLFGLPAIDPITLIATIVLFAIVTVTATYTPVRRALRINPTQALRYE